MENEHKKQKSDEKQLTDRYNFPSSSSSSFAMVWDTVRAGIATSDDATHTVKLDTLGASLYRVSDLATISASHGKVRSLIRARRHPQVHVRTARCPIAFWHMLFCWCMHHCRHGRPSFRAQLRISACVN